MPLFGHDGTNIWRARVLDMILGDTKRNDTIEFGGWLQFKYRYSKKIFVSSRSDLSF